MINSLKSELMIHRLKEEHAQALEAQQKKFEREAEAQRKVDIAMGMGLGAGISYGIYLKKLQ